MVELNRFHEESVIWLSELFDRSQADGTVSEVMDPVREAHACLTLVEGAQPVSRATGDPTLFDLATAGIKARMG
jgi:TetR/AcrR family transcriptional repressor of nem operon